MPLPFCVIPHFAFVFYIISKRKDKLGKWRRKSSQRLRELLTISAPLSLWWRHSFQLLPNKKSCLFFSECEIGFGRNCFNPNQISYATNRVIVLTFWWPFLHFPAKWGSESFCSRQTPFFLLLFTKCQCVVTRVQAERWRLQTYFLTTTRTPWVKIRADSLWASRSM